MPVHNRPDIAEALRKFADVDPPGGFYTMSPEIVPIVVVGDLIERKEASKPAFGLKSFTSNPTNGAALGVRAVPGSGLLAVIERMIISAEAAGTVILYRGDHSLTGGVSYGQWRDDRIRGQPGLQLRFQDTNTVTPADQVGDFRVAPDDPLILDMPISISAEALTFLLVGTTQLAVTFFWREYQITEA